MQKTKLKAFLLGRKSGKKILAKIAENHAFGGE